jgi:hypothetical protein
LVAAYGRDEVGNPRKLAMQKNILVAHVVRSFHTAYEAFISRFESQPGKHDVSAYWNRVADLNCAKDVEAILHGQEGSSGLIVFTTYDHGTLLNLKGVAFESRATRKR